MITTLRIAIKSVWYSASSNVFTAIGLAAVLAPLLVLYGLKLGVINGLVAQLKTDPNILRVGVNGNRVLHNEDIEAIRALPQAGFVIGQPRSIAARVEMRPAPDRIETEVVDWLPTATGDPILPDGVAVPGDDEIILSEQLAEKFAVAAGDVVAASVFRNSQSEVFDMALTVTAVMPRSRMAGYRALVSGERLELAAAFSDGFAIAEAGGTGKPLDERNGRYDRIRLYAASMADVADLERAVAEYGFKTTSNADRIAWVSQLEGVMTGVFGIIAAAGVIGYAVALWATIADSVRQSRPQLSLLQLLGMSRVRLWIFPLVQVIAIATLGLVAAFALAFCAAVVLNHVYLISALGGAICQIRPTDLAIAAAASYALAICVALQQFQALQRIAPSEALAESI